MLATGILVSLYLNAISPVGTPGMTEDEALRLILEQQENQDFGTLAGILTAVGFMLVLISFGARRRGGAPKKEEKQPGDPREPAAAG